MTTDRDIAVLVGSLRKDSWNRKAAEAVISVAPEHMKFRFVDIGVSLYNQDLDTDEPPADWRRLRDGIAPADGVLFATPEYNRAVPGPMKNAIDIASRPPHRSALQGKPVAIMSISIGQIGGFGANHDLRRSCTFLDMPVLQQPEVYLGPAEQLFGVNGEIKQEGTRTLLRNFITKFGEMIEQLRAPSPHIALRAEAGVDAPHAQH